MSISVCQTGCAIAALVAGFALGAGAVADPDVHYQAIAVTGDPAPPLGARTYVLLDPPVINESGNVAFDGSDSAGDSLWFGALLAGSYGVRIAMDEGDALVPIAINPPSEEFGYDNSAKISGSLGRAFAAPVLSDSNRIAVLANYGPVPKYTLNGGTSYTPIEISSQTFQALLRIRGDLPTASIETIAMTSMYVRTDPGFEAEDPPSAGENVGYYLSFVQDFFGDLAHIAQTKTESDASTPAFYLKATGVSTGGTQEVKPGGIWWSPNETDWGTVIREGDTLGGFEIGELPVDFDNSFLVHTISNHHMTAYAVSDTDTQNFDVWNIGKKPAHSANVLIAREGVTDAPGAGVGVKFSNLEFAPVVNDDGMVAFRAQTDDGGKWGIWAERDVGGTPVLQNIAYAGDVVPDAGAMGSEDGFIAFGDPVMNDQNVLAFVGRWENSLISATPLGVFTAHPVGGLDSVALEGANAPYRPNTTQSIGTFVADFGDPSLNDTGNVAFRAGLDITNATFSQRLSNVVTAGFPATAIVEEGVFITDEAGICQTVVCTGMTLDEIADDPNRNGDDRVVVAVEFLHTQSDVSIDKTFTSEGNGSGHQDGRRIGVTDLYTDMTQNPDGGTTTCKRMRVAFKVSLADPSDGSPSSAVVVGEYENCITVGGGGGCTTCLCSTDPNCMMGSMALGAGPDFTGDGLVDDTDLNLTIQAMGYTTGRFDMDQSGFVDATDFAIVYEAYKVDLAKQSEAESK